MPHAILLVDDNDINRKLVRHILSDEFPELYEAANGAECLTVLQSRAVDLVLLDLNMPEKSGFDVLQELPALPLKRLPTVIVLSADNEPDTISRAFHLGAADYVSTPFNRDELLARVRTHLALHNREQYLEERVQARTAELQQANQRLQAATAQLIQAEKMVSLGQLAAGVAHEINNPVGYINSNLDTLKAYLGDVWRLVDSYAELESQLPDSEALDDLRQLKQRIDPEYLREDSNHLIAESMQGVERVKHIVSDLKGFAHPEQKAWQQVDLHQLLRSSLNIVANEIKYKCTVNLALGEVVPVHCIGPQISQVILNLLINASQAIPEKGEITIRSGQGPGAGQVWLSVEDTGIGMSKEVMGKIFDPFFTTKTVGEGTGLGLSVSYGIVQMHGGEIMVRSEPGKGSCFTLVLPVVPPGQPTPADVEGGQSGQATSA
ncbi:response regulator receiver sensor signal transduction histidine kinase [Simiduia agarivorans SA1 = DSM 21679]|uniref:histidine kinase n=2 Tax=Simiduia TaxID=447467 RepID=K4KM53_SIMAS|nr:response regulator receiver sensor signal transduction histidine kinase [Simiduia agarivorans SA1 = DSM 21679]